jgi:hypothetical protein
MLKLKMNYTTSSPPGQTFDKVHEVVSVITGWKQMKLKYGMIDEVWEEDKNIVTSLSLKFKVAAVTLNFKRFNFKQKMAKEKLECSFVEEKEKLI